MERSLLHFVATLDASLRHSLENVAASHGELTINQLRYLEAAHRLDRPTVSDIAEALGVSRASASTAVTGLVAGGFLAKTPSAEDRRAVQVSLTDRGMEPVRARDRAVQTYGEFIRSVLTTEEASQFEMIIGKLVAGFANSEEPAS